MTTDAQLDQDELLELLRDSESLAQPKKPMHQICPIPGSIFINRGTVIAEFVCPESSSFAYTDIGVFATGHWALADDVTEDIVIPYQSIDHIRFDSDKLKEAIEDHEGSSD